jgi:hypothetical protein
MDRASCAGWASASPAPKGQHVEGALAEGLALGRRPYCLYLPLYNSPETLEIGIEAGAHLKPLPPRDEKPILFYGTSILHGASAARAGMGIPAIVGRRLRRSVINLAFSGNGKMEPEIADLLAELDPCLFVVDCLPNMVATEITERAAPLVRRIRAGLTPRSCWSKTAPTPIRDSFQPRASAIAPAAPPCVPPGTNSLNRASTTSTTSMATSCCPTTARPP